MRRWLSGTGMVLLCVAGSPFLSACGGGASGSGGGGGDITIGVVAPVTGDDAEDGKHELNGVNLAVAEVNKAGGADGRKIKIDTEDSRTTNSGAISAFSKLTGGDVAGVIGPIYSTEVQAMTPSIKQAGVPVVIGGTDPELTHEGDRWVFRTRPNDTYSALTIAKFGVSDKGVKTWAVIASSDAFGSTGAKHAIQNIQKDGGKVVLNQAYPNHSQDFTSVVLALKRSGAQGLVTYCTFAQDCGVLARQMGQQQVKVTWVGSPSLVTPTALNLGGASLYGTYAVTDFWPSANPTAAKFAKNYQSKYNAKADIFAAYAYDGIHILAKAISNAKSTDPAKVRNAILAIKGYQLAEGTYTFDKNGDGLFGYNVVQNANGSLKFVKRLEFSPQQQ